ncbi:competence protein CoiA family protein [uncultured Alistipes sp.]|uniref:competence protein CoiA family protein n=1 Tax=uncultured Alistipes sp. TaxID=538949 RepID=UPI0026185CD3|nr:competence protein CoiA family protein [uncultured Alistipes sp.]
MKPTANTVQHYALDPDGKLIWIKNAQRNVQFTCVNCGGKMIVKQGKIKEWHFAHKTLSENCNHESYLHSLAKKKIYDWFYQADKFTLSLKTLHRCSQIDECRWFNTQEPSYCLTTKLHAIDLKTFYNSCDIERTYKNFRADLFLYHNQSNRPPIFIEVCVTHPCSKEKINSGIRIIELIIKSENTINSLINTVLSENDENVKLYNFNPKPQIVGSCYKELNKFILYKRNKHSCDLIDCKTYNERNPESIFELTIDTNGRILKHSIHEIGFATAYKYKYSVRSCFLCKYHKNNTDTMYDYGGPRLPIFCCLYKKRKTNKYCKSTAALECSAFNVDKELCNIIKEWIYYNNVEIWKRPDNSV